MIWPGPVLDVPCFNHDTLLPSALQIKSPREHLTFFPFASLKPDLHMPASLKRGIAGIVV